MIWICPEEFRADLGNRAGRADVLLYKIEWEEFRAPGSNYGGRNDVNGEKGAELTWGAGAAGCRPGRVWLVGTAWSRRS